MDFIVNYGQFVLLLCCYLTGVTSSTLKVETGKTATVPCLYDVSNADLFYWKFLQSTIVHVQNGVSTINNDDYNVTDSGDLIITNVTHAHSGTYTFTISNELDQTNTSETDVRVVDPPTDPTGLSTPPSIQTTVVENTKAPNTGFPIAVIAVLIVIAAILIFIGLFFVCKKRRAERLHDNHGIPHTELNNYDNPEREPMAGDQNHQNEDAIEANPEPQLTGAELLRDLETKFHNQEVTLDLLLETLKIHLRDGQITQEECKSFIINNIASIVAAIRLQEWLQDMLQRDMMPLSSCLEVLLSVEELDLHTLEEWLTNMRDYDIINLIQFLEAYIELAKRQEQYARQYLELLLNLWRASKIESGKYIELSGTLLKLKIVGINEWLNNMQEAEQVYKDDQIYADDYLEYLIGLCADEAFDAYLVIEKCLEYMQKARITPEFYVDALFKIKDVRQEIGGKPAIDLISDDFRYRVYRHEIDAQLFVHAMSRLMVSNEDAQDSLLAVVAVALAEGYFSTDEYTTAADNLLEEEKVSRETYDLLIGIV